MTWALEEIILIVQLLLDLLAKILLKHCMQVQCSEVCFRNPISKHYDKHMSMRRDSYGSS